MLPQPPIPFLLISTAPQLLGKNRDIEGKIRIDHRRRKYWKYGECGSWDHLISRGPESTQDSRSPTDPNRRQYLHSSSMRRLRIQERIWKMEIVTKTKDEELQPSNHPSNGFYYFSQDLPASPNPRKEETRIPKLGNQTKEPQMFRLMEEEKKGCTCSPIR